MIWVGWPLLLYFLSVIVSLTEAKGMQSVWLLKNDRPNNCCNHGSNKVNFKNNDNKRRRKKRVCKCSGMTSL